MKTLVVGLGNPILGDDGIGWRVAEEVKRRLGSPSPSMAVPSTASGFPVEEEYPDFPRIPGEGEQDSVEFELLSAGGISLMEHLIGYERAILIDAVACDREPGSVITSELGEMPDASAFHITSAHDTSLQNALTLGEVMGADLPDQIIVVGIATQRVYDFGEELSLPVAQAISRAAQTVINLL